MLVALASFTTMQAVNLDSNFVAGFTLLKNELREIWLRRISLQHAKAGYSYPTIRLPHTFSMLAGLPIKIYQTIHNGVLAFLVVISPKEKALESRIARLAVA
jgi:hypothetical protein